MNTNQCAFRHLPRRRPFNDSTKALSVGLPGRLKSGGTPFSYAQRSSASEMNFGPLLGAPACFGPRRRESRGFRRVGRARRRQAGKCRCGSPTSVQRSILALRPLAEASCLTCARPMHDPHAFYLDPEGPEFGPGLDRFLGALP
jgi:hypothetical protein